MMKKSISLMIAAGIILPLMACTNTNTPQYAGDASTRGYCGRSGKEYKIPISNEIDPKFFTEAQDVAEGEYQVNLLSIFVRSEANNPDSAQLMASHGSLREPIFIQDTFLNSNFYKNCSRGMEFEKTGSFQVTLPVKLNLAANKTWNTVNSATYTLEYGKQFPTFLNLKAELDATPSPSSSDRDFKEVLFLEKVEKSKSSKAKKSNYQVMTIEEFKTYYQGFPTSVRLTEKSNLDKEYAAYLDFAEAFYGYVKPVDVKEQQTPKTAEELKAEKKKPIFLQIHVSDDPLIYARAELTKIEAKKDEAKPEEVKTEQAE